MKGEEKLDSSRPGRLLPMSESDSNDDFFMAGETPGAWLHLTGDPWITPDDILSDPTSSMTLRGERSPTDQSVPPNSPFQLVLGDSNQGFDPDSDTLPSPPLSSQPRKEREAMKNRTVNSMRIKRSHDCLATTPCRSNHGVGRKRSRGSQSTSSKAPVKMWSIPENASKTRIRNAFKRTVESGGDAREPSASGSSESTPFGPDVPKGCVNLPFPRQKTKVPSLEYPITPIALDLGALAVIAALPDLVTGTPTVKLKSGSVFALLTPEQTCWQRATYIAGPIRLETSFVPPSASALTDMDLLQNSLALGSTTETDDAVLDEVVDFFMSFGLRDIEQPGSEPKFVHSTCPESM